MKGSPLLKNRLLLTLFVPVMTVGLVLAALVVFSLLPPLKKSIKDRIEAEILLASRLGIEACERNLDYLLELRLEDDPNMNTALREESLKEVLAFSGALRELHMVVAGEDGVVVGASVPHPGGKIPVDQLGIGAGSVTRGELWGRPVHMHTRLFPYWGWYVTSFIFENDYNAPIRRISQAVLLGTFGVLFSVLAALFLLFRFYVQGPLSRLGQGAREVSEGHYPHLEGEGSDEIGGLVKSFNAMIEALKEKDQRLQDLIRELRESRNRLRTLFLTSPDILTVNDLPEGKIADVNDAFVARTGYAREEAIGKTPGELGLWQSGETSDRILETLERQGRAENVEVSYRTKSGEMLTGLVSARRVELQGRPHILSITRDITRQKALERELLEARKREAVGVLAGGIAHQFNNALSGVTGSIQLLQFTLRERGELKGEVAEYTENLLQLSGRMAGLTSQLLAYARGGKYREAPLNLSRFVEKAASRSGHILREGIFLETDLAADLPDVMADRGQMEMVLMALLSNAAEAIEGEGRIVVRTGLETAPGAAEADGPGPVLFLEVSDDGCGMDRETREKIFDPFFSTKFQGRGLGMAAVSGIVTNHGGKILVESEPGRGTTVRITLPVLDQPTEGRS